MFQIIILPKAFDDIAWFRKRDQQVVFDDLEQQLSHEPNVETRHRKRLRPNDIAEWELRIGQFRVFYDVDTAAGSVTVCMVGRKEGSRLSVRGKEMQL